MHEERRQAEMAELEKRRRAEEAEREERRQAEMAELTTKVSFIQLEARQKRGRLTDEDLRSSRLSTTYAGALKLFEERGGKVEPLEQLDHAPAQSLAASAAVDAEQAVGALDDSAKEKDYYPIITHAINKAVKVNRQGDQLVAFDTSSSSISQHTTRCSDVTVRCVPAQIDVGDIEQLQSCAKDLTVAETLFVVEVKPLGKALASQAKCKGQLLAQLQDVVRDRPGSTSAWGFLTDGKTGFAARVHLERNVETVCFSEQMPFSFMLYKMQQVAQLPRDEMLNAWGVNTRVVRAFRALREPAGTWVGDGACGWVISAGPSSCVKIAKHEREDIMKSEVEAHAALLQAGGPVVPIQKAVKGSGEVVEEIDALAGDATDVVAFLMPVVRRADLTTRIAEAAEALHAIHERGFALIDMGPSTFREAADGTLQVIDLGGAVNLGEPLLLSKDDFMPNEAQLGDRLGEFVAQSSRRLDFVILTNVWLVGVHKFPRESPFIVGLVQSLIDCDDADALRAFKEVVMRQFVV